MIYVIKFAFNKVKGGHVYDLTLIMFHFAAFAGLLAFCMYHVQLQTNSQNCGGTKEFQSLRELAQEPQNVLASNFGFCRLTNTSGSAGIVFYLFS